jgi:DNA-binding CsgD family transcriptional regulator
MLSDEDWARLRRQMMLTGREMQVLRGVFDEQTDEAIAVTLGIRPRTVRTHLERLYRKCGCHTSSGAVASAFRTFVGIHHREHGVHGE